MKYISFILFLILTLANLNAQNYKVVHSDNEKIQVEFDFNGKYEVRDTLIDGKNFCVIKGKDFFIEEYGKPWLPKVQFNLGIPADANPTIKILSVDKKILSNKFVIPFPKNDPEIKQAGFEKEEFSEDDFNKAIYNSNKNFPEEISSVAGTFKMRYINTAAITVSPFQFNPVSRQLIFNSKILLEINYNNSGSVLGESIDDPMTIEFVKNNLINSSIAESWIKKDRKLKSPASAEDYWYNPSKDFYKFFLKTEGVYRITYQYLASAGVPLVSTPISDLELFNNGERVPINVIDFDNNNIFNEGDYFEFIGKPAAPTPYAKQNIYNTKNVYWFSYQGAGKGLFYKEKNGDPFFWERSTDKQLRTIHYEQDKIYERLGYAPDEKRDYWFWGIASAEYGVSKVRFQDQFPGFPEIVNDSYVTLRVNMHGMTNDYRCSTDHNAKIYINDKKIGEIEWDGQTEITFEGKFYVHQDSVPIYPGANDIVVEVHGDACSVNPSDQIRINWYELDYWRYNRGGTYYAFKSNPNEFGITRFWTWLWPSKNVKIYIPQKGEMITNFLYGPAQDNAIIFIDTVQAQTDYYMIADHAARLSIDSIAKDAASDYRNISNGADYIIITHPLLKSAAERLAEYRENNFPDSSIINPRIFIADVEQIYDEFSYGLLDPFALQKFVKYAFENWQQPAPAYVVLFGDMSWDYRQLLPASRPNFVPSIPVHAASLGTELSYGQAVSDNRIVAVSGNDPYPDLAIGRLSCESVEEGNILVDKIINYGADKSKAWRQNVLLVSSGQNLVDENSFRFNDENMAIAKTLLDPIGIASEKIFRYPNRPEYVQYQGDGPEIREGFKKGAALVNYYGHGGGAQWDLVFLNDDIYLLENKDKLPVVTSATCYTAHFDNQDVFGEHFIKVPDKGAIGFVGSSGLTLWGAGKFYNHLFYEAIFQKKIYNVGKALLDAANRYLRGKEYDLQLAVYTYLGDPLVKLVLPEKPDYVVQTNDISISPQNPLVNDSVDVKIKIKNYGIISEDSVTVQLLASSADTSYEIGIKKIPNFGELDSLNFTWYPASGGLYELTVKVNETDIIPEEDHSDNITTASFAVFNLTEPNILSPEKGFSTNESKINFLFSDIGHYVDKELSYIIEIDTTLDFQNPVIVSGFISPQNGLLNWQSPQLNKGEYLWRSRIFDGENFGNWSPVRGFLITDTPDSGYSSSGKLLKLYDTYNIMYSDESHSLVLNTEPLPPKPDRTRFLGDIYFNTAGIENLGLTTITTDGTYIYFANIWYYSLRHNPQGYSKIHKIGTGYNGTTKGQYYGTIPGFNYKIVYQMFYHSDGFIYAATGDAHSLLKINVETGDTTSVVIPDGLLESESARVQNGAFYITSDGQYVYNLTVKDSLGNNKYVLRTFDPANNWSLAKPDMVLSGSSYFPYFSGFFVAAGYLYPLENFNDNYIRRIRLEDGVYEEEWYLNLPYQNIYYALCYDWIHDEVYASVFKTGLQPRISKFKGRYFDASGTITSEIIGPASVWNKLNYTLETAGSQGSYSVTLKGLNKNTREWETLKEKIPNTFLMNEIQASQYPYLQLEFVLNESSNINSIPLKLKNVKVNYSTPPEIILTKNNFRFTPDTLLQGFNTNMKLQLKNIGGYVANNINVKFYLNNADSSFYSANVNLPKDSTAEINYEIATSSILFENKIKSIVTVPSLEYFTYNNILEQSFFVARDSIKPEFKITFDGEEIINEDIVSAAPEVMITLADNSPLPLDTSYFTLVHNNLPLRFSREDVEYFYEPYPNSKFTIRWNPKLEDGRHTLEVLAKDASGNFFDSTSSRTVFYVYNDNDMLNVFNYPNPFTNDTYFTFELRGTEIPEEFIVKIYTIAGRLIRDLSIPSSELKIGFNKIYWDGRDQDGDEIGNGLYFYKIISKLNGQVKSTTQKLVKVK